MEENGKNKLILSKTFSKNKGGGGRASSVCATTVVFETTESVDWAKRLQFSTQRQF